MADLSQLSDAELMAALGQGGGSPAPTVIGQGKGITVELDPQTQGAPGGVPRGIRNNNPLNLKTRGTAGQDGDFAVYRSPEEGRAAADANLQAYGTKHGINTISGVVSRWAPPTENDTAAYISHVAQQTGIDPNAQIDLGDPATRGRLLDAMQAHEVGQAGGSAPQPNLQGMSDADLMAALGQGADPASALPPEPKPPKQPPPNQTLQEAASGFAQPFVSLGHDVAEAYRNHGSRMGDIPRIASDLMAVTGAPIQAAVRPLAGVISRALPAPSNTHVEWHGLIPHQYVDGKMTPEQARGAIEGDLNTALQAVRPKGLDLAASRAASAQVSAVPGRNLTQQTRALAPQMPVQVPRVTAQLGELQAAKNAAYKRVDSLGAAYTGKAKADLGKAIVDGLTAEGIDQGANPGSWSAMQRAKGVLSGKKPVTLSDLDNLRQTAWRQAAGLKGPDKEAERYYGAKIIEAIDQFVDTAQPGHMASGANPQQVAAAIKEARLANQRYKKVQTISNELDSANLRSASTYAGGNKANAIRQELRPLVDPTSNRRMRGLSPAEDKALRRVVNGTPVQNAIRVTGKLLDPRGLLGASLQGALGLPSGGASTLAMVPGAAASELSNHLTMKSVQQLIDLLANGGKAAKAAPQITARGLIGAGALAAPVARQSEPRR